MLLVNERIKTLGQELARALEQDRMDAAVRLSRRLSYSHVARTVIETPKEQALVFLKALGPERTAQVIASMPEELAVNLVMEMDDDDAVVSLLQAMDMEDAARFVAQLPESRRAGVVERLEPDLTATIDQLTSYPDDTAGHAMSPHFLAVTTGTLISDAMAAVRGVPTAATHAAYVYVVNGQGTLIGVASLRDFMRAQPNTPVDRIMTTEVLAIRVTDPAVDGARRIRSRGYKLLPVVDHDDRLVGVITFEKAIDLLAEEVADDFTGFATAPIDESFFTPPRTAIKGRLPWMAANVFLNLGAVFIITQFEATIAQVAILAAFLPMITDMGGNVGIQALSVSIRSLALGEVRLRDVSQAMHKEVTIGLFNGVVLGLLFAVLAFIVEANVVLALVAGLALAVNVLLAGIVGGTIPFFIKRLGYDPAMMTGPVLTTITDITGVTVYLGLSTIFLAGLLAGI